MFRRFIGYDPSVSLQFFIYLSIWKGINPFIRNLITHISAFLLCPIKSGVNIFSIKRNRCIKFMPAPKINEVNRAKVLN